MLDAHEHISAPHPPHLLRTFYPFLSFYGDVKERGNRIELVNDMCDWVEANPVPWEGTILDRDRIVANSSTVIDVFRHIYEARMHHDQANMWCCKSTFNINFVQDLELEIKPFYIYLYRDGRDVATSFKKAIVGPKHIYHLAQKWSQEQKSARTFLASIPDERYITMAYEDILEQPAVCVQKICDKLRITYESKMLQFYDSKESRRTADSGEMWKNVLKPVMKNNTRKFEKELPLSDIALFESIANDELNRLGYRRVSTKNITFEGEVASFEIQNQQLMEQARRNASEQDKEKRAAQKLLLTQIRQRLGIDEQVKHLA